MKKSTIKSFYKKIAIIILIIMSCNFLVPQIFSNKVFAEEEPELFSPLANFFCAVGDIAMSFLQKMFVGQREITTYGTNFEFKYSPAVIFSGTLPAFDINFISPMPNTEKYELVEPEKTVAFKQTAVTAFYDNNNPVVVYKTETSNLRRMEDLHQEMMQMISNPQTIPEENKHFTTGQDIVKKKDLISRIQYWQETYGYYNETTTRNYQDTNMVFTEKPMEYSYWLIENDANNQTTKYSIYVAHKIFNEDNSITQIYQIELRKAVLEKQATLESVARITRNTIASWYNVMRTIALVGLLSVLVYVAIRMIISSSTEDKAKYKKMIFDWFVALFIVMTLHYIIAFTLAIIGAISNALTANIIDLNGTDRIFSQLRRSISSDFNILTLVMYYTLIILTIKYTIQYLKRFVYIAFLTMIGPIVGLTYPLDKIKDGQAQAFTLWIKEFLFNSLLQLFHLILYYVFVGNSVMGEFAIENPFYALVVLAFLPSAEKFLRKMFGFDKKGELGDLEAAFGGATVMNMISSLGSSSAQGKGNSKGSGEPSGSGKVRLANEGASNPYAALMQGKGNHSTQGQNVPQEQSGTGRPGGRKSTGSSSGGRTSGRGNGTGGSGQKSPSVQSGAPGKRNVKNRPSRIAGLKNLGKKYVLNKNVGMGILRGAGKVAGAATLGTIGLAAGISTGDMKNAFTGAIGGITAGRKVGGNLVDGGANIVNGAARGVRNIGDTYREGKYGEEEYARMKFDKEFKQSTEYKRLTEKYEGQEENIQEFLNSGITDTRQMEIAIKNIKEGKYRNVREAAAYATMANAKDCPASVLYDQERFRVYLTSKDIIEDLTKEIDEINKQNNQVKKLKAQYEEEELLPKEILDNENKFISYLIENGELEDLTKERKKVENQSEQIRKLRQGVVRFK